VEITARPYSRMDCAIIKFLLEPYCEIR